MLDPSEQAKMIQLLKQLQVDRGMAMIFISHDLSVVMRVADRVLVLDGGRVVEEGSGGSLLVAPQHPATRDLLEASGRDLLFAADGNASPTAADGPEVAHEVMSQEVMSQEVIAQGGRP